MIIDLILDRYGYNGDNSGVLYRAHDFYFNVLEYENTFDLPHNITIAMDYDGEPEIKKALCDYVKNGGYNPAICDYINRVSWLNNDGGYYEPLQDITDDTGSVIFERGISYGAYYASDNEITFKVNNKRFTFDRQTIATFFVAH